MTDVGCTKLAGIGLKSCHYDRILAALPPLPFFEVHAENYMGDGGPPHRWLSAIRDRYDLSVHGVGLSLGTIGPLDTDHLDALASVVERYRPKLVSEHLAWSGIDGVYLNDLLPIPYTERALDLFCAHLDQTQDRLGRTILIENPSATFAYRDTDMSEPAFLAALVARTGCGILLDVNNVYVSARNLGFDPYDYLAALPLGAIGEYHLAGHTVRRVGERTEIRIDDHGSAVCADVWDLYRTAVARFGPHPTLIEWDNDIPDLDVLIGQAALADRIAAEACEGRHALAS